MSWFKKVFGSQLSQETKVYYEKQKEKQNEEEENQPKIDELEIGDSQQPSQESWCSTWSGLSQTFNSPKGQKREFSSDDEEDKWWKSFCSVNEFKKETNSSSSQQGSSSQSQHETTSNKNVDENNGEDDDAIVSFYLKLERIKNSNTSKFLV